MKPLLFVLPLVITSSALAQLPPMPAPPQNPVTEAKRILGKALFWDEQLSSDNTVACGTCHRPASGGGDPTAGQPGSNHPGLDSIFGTPDDKRASRGVIAQDTSEDYDPSTAFDFAKQVTDRASPSHLGAGHFPELFWDGRATGQFLNPETGAISIPNGGALESQAVGPILSSVEMAYEGRTWDDVRNKLERVDPLALAFNLNPDLTAALSGGVSYPDLFNTAFGDSAITAERIGFALATYERTLNPDQTPWDRHQAGIPGSLTPNQIDGMMAFGSPQSRCTQCHQPPLFSDGSYRNLGLRPIGEDNGRRNVTGQFGDRGRFKVPSLRNVGLRTRFMHQGQFSQLPQIMGFYDQDGGPNNANKDPLLTGLMVPPPVGQAIVDFLANGLTDPRVAAEAPPFDRPRLNTERLITNPEIVGTGTNGSGGMVPTLIAETPPRLGSRDFKLGVHDALGGAHGFVVWYLSAPGAPGYARRMAVTLSGSGAGNGFATSQFNLPNDPTLSGLELWGQFWVLDPGAAGNFARSPFAHVTLF